MGGEGPNKATVVLAPWMQGAGGATQGATPGCKGGQDSREGQIAIRPILQVGWIGESAAMTSELPPVPTFDCRSPHGSH